MTKLTKRIWRWEYVRGYHVIAEEQGLNWFRPIVYLRPYGEVLAAALQNRNEAILDLVNSTPLMRHLVAKERGTGRDDRP